MESVEVIIRRTIAGFKQMSSKWHMKDSKSQMLPNKATLQAQVETSENLKTLAKNMTDKWLSSEDDTIWEEWVDKQNRERWDLIKLLSTDAQEGMKRRALFLLMVPSDELNTIYWKENDCRFYYEQDFFKKLPDSLLKFAVEMLTEFISAVRPLHCDQPENLVLEGQGITMFMPIPDKYHNALYFYNNCILALLPLIPEEQGERLIPLFSLNDISTYWDMNGSSGYNPFQSLLLYTDNMDEKWKWKADARMRTIILDELAGRTKPRKDYERAIGCYAHIIQLQLYSRSNKLSYSVELFASQLEFIADHHQKGQNLINVWKVSMIFGLLVGDKYKELRYKLARMIVFEDDGDFSKSYLYDEIRALGAEMILAEFGKTDLELGNILQRFIQEGKKEKAAECCGEKARIKNLSC